MSAHRRKRSYRRRASVKRVFKRIMATPIGRKLVELYAEQHEMLRAEAMLILDRATFQKADLDKIAEYIGVPRQEARLAR